MSEIDDLEETLWFGRKNGAFFDPAKLSMQERRKRGYLGSSAAGRKRADFDIGRRPEPSLPKFKCLED